MVDEINRANESDHGLCKTYILGVKIVSVFPDQMACAENLVGEREVPVPGRLPTVDRRHKGDRLLPGPLPQAAPTIAELPAGLNSYVLLRRPDVVQALNTSVQTQLSAARH
jgi:hypothetical protein